MLLGEGTKTYQFDIAQVKPTAATYTLRDPTEVMSFLGQLVAWGRTDANAWHRSASCSGWDLNPDTSSPADATTDGPLQPLDTLPEASGRRAPRLPRCLPVMPVLGPRQVQQQLAMIFLEDGLVHPSTYSKKYPSNLFPAIRILLVTSTRLANANDQAPAQVNLCAAVALRCARRPGWHSRGRGRRRRRRPNAAAVHQHRTAAVAPGHLVV